MTGEKVEASMSHFVIDATSIREDRITGIERYALGISTHLPEAMPEATWTIITSVSSPLGIHANAELVSVGGWSRAVRDQIGIPRVLRSTKVTAAFFPGFTPPLLMPRSIKVIAQIHDSALWRYPETLSRGAKLYYKPVLEFNLRRRAIDAVITSSKTAERDLQPYLPPEIPVFGIPPGVQRHGLEAASHSGRPPRDETDYALAVGTIEPRKNYGTLLAAWELLARRGLRIPLKIVGRPGWGDGPPPSAVARELVEFVGSVSDDALAQLYADCRIFVMPSLHEGFGVPVVEAMLRGRSCLVSDIPVFREIGESLLTYVPPRSALDWAAAIESEWASSPQTPRDDVIARAEYFTWQRCAAAIAAVFRDTISRG